MPDSLDADLNREVMMVCAGAGCGKSLSVAHLCSAGLEHGFNVVVLDRERGLAKAIKEVCGKVPDNLDYFACTKWEKYQEGLKHAFENLSSGDWLVFEMLGGMWDLAQSHYSRMVYGSDATQHLLDLRKDAEERLGTHGRGKEENRERQAAVQFNGMEGRTDWPLIKRIHSDEMIEDAIYNGSFNILSTTSMSMLEDGQEGKWPMWSVLGRRPEGEKHNEHRHDTIAVLSIGTAGENKGKHVWQTDLGGGRGKDRGDRELVKPTSFEGTGFIQSYYEYFGLDLGAK